MSLSEQRSQADIEIHRDELRAHAMKVCRNLSETLLLGSVTPSKEAVSTALEEFAKANLNTFSFFNSSSRLMSASDMRRAACVIEALASESGTLASIYLVNAIMAGSCIAAAGTESQRSELLPQLGAGTIQVAFAMTEPEAGSDAASMTTSAVSNAAGGFQINGEKLFATGAATADRIIVVARTIDDPKRRSFGLFNLASDAPALEIEPLEHKLAAGLHATCRVRLKNVTVTSDDVLGGPAEVGNAWASFTIYGHAGKIVGGCTVTGSCVSNRRTRG